MKALPQYRNKVYLNRRPDAYLYINEDGDVGWYSGWRKDLKIPQPDDPEWCCGDHNHWLEKGHLKHISNFEVVRDYTPQLENI